MNKMVLVPLLLMLSTSVGAEEWDLGDKGLYLGTVIAMGIDLHNTDRNIKGGGKEYNPLLTTHPNTNMCIGAFVVNTVLYYVVADYLPKPWRKWFLSGAITVHLTCVYRGNNI